MRAYGTANRPDLALEPSQRAIVLLEGLDGDDATGNLAATWGIWQISHYDAAEAWYARSRELAEKRNDRYQLTAIVQNAGILHQRRAEQVGDPEARNGLLEAVR